MLLDGGTKTTVDKLIEIFGTLGVHFESTKKGEINFDELSIRAQNALRRQKIFLEEELLNLNEKKLGVMPNLEKTINEILKFQDKLRNNPEIQFSLKKLFFFHVLILFLRKTL